MLKKKWQSPLLTNVDKASRTAVVMAHQHHRHKLAKNRGKPFSGAYYWVPDSDHKWSLLVHPNAFYEGNEAGHADVWEDVVLIFTQMHALGPSDLLKRIGNCPYGLPRGRVVKLGSGEWGVAHGNDHPPEASLESMVIEEFCLQSVRPKFFVDDHEQMLAVDRDCVQSTLGVR